MHFFILAALASIFGAHVLEPLNEQPRAALTDEIVFCAQDTTVASPLTTATGTYIHGYHNTATPNAMLGAAVRGAYNRGLLYGATEAPTPRLTCIGGMDLQAEPTAFDGILSQNGARSGPGRIHVHHRPSGPTPAHHTTVAIPTPIPTCPKAREREHILMPETAAHTSPPARPIEPALLWGEQLLPPPMARDFIIGIACFMMGCVVATVAIQYGQGTVSDGPNDDGTDNDSPNDGGTDDDNATDDDGNSDQEVRNKHQMPVDDEDANDRSDRPTEPALLWGEQLLPPPMPQYLAISIVSFMVGCVVTTVAIQYVQGTVGEAANDETVDGGDVVDAAQADRVDQGTVPGIEVVDAAQSARTNQDTVAEDTVVDAAHPARSDGGTVAGGDGSKPWRKTHRGTRGGKNKKNAPPDTQPDGSATGPSDLPLMSEYQGSQKSAQAQEPVNTQSQKPANEANDSGSSLRNRYGQDGANDMAAAAVQQAPVDSNSAVNDSADEQPAGSAAEPGNSEPWKSPRKSKRGGVKVRARLERRLERLAATASQQPDEEPDRYSQQSNEDQAPATAFSSNNRRYNRTKK
ncbi:hypothetical protein H4S03_007583, partial [Coemansia sp. S3946]